MGVPPTPHPSRRTLLLRERAPCGHPGGRGPPTTTAGAPEGAGAVPIRGRSCVVTVGRGRVTRTPSPRLPLRRPFAHPGRVREHADLHHREEAGGRALGAGDLVKGRGEVHAPGWQG